MIGIYIQYICYTCLNRIGSARDKNEKWIFNSSQFNSLTAQSDLHQYNTK